MSHIASPEDWWKLWIDRRSDILSIAEDKLGIEMEEILEGRTSSLAYDINAWTDDQEWEPLWEFLNRIWEEAPDGPVIHSWEGWSDLCDLCSEKWVFAGIPATPEK